MLSRFVRAFIIIALATTAGPTPVLAAESPCPFILDHKFGNLLDEPVSLCEFRGKVLLIVNTASECGYTPQYEGLEALYRKYRERGLVVLGFPMNDFGGQEPGSNKQIAEFCVNQYAIDFPMFAKSAVAKGAVNPFYERLATASNSRPAWNFHKYLVDRAGRAVQSFDTRVAPGDAKLVGAIEKLLAEKP